VFRESLGGFGTAFRRWKRLPLREGRIRPVPRDDLLLRVEPGRLDDERRKTPGATICDPLRDLGSSWTAAANWTFAASRDASSRAPWFSPKPLRYRRADGLVDRPRDPRRDGRDGLLDDVADRGSFRGAAHQDSFTAFRV
jgi:hypothetical protein